MKRIIVFGATGGTGRLVVEQSLQAGHQVTAVIRDPGQFRIKHENLRVVKGDVFEPGSFEKAMKEQDVVVSCLGIPKAKPTIIYSTGISNIVAVMKRARVRRILCISSSAVVVPNGSSLIMKFLLNNIIKRLHKPVHSDMLLMENKLIRSGLDYTIIRAPMLTDGSHTGKYRITENEPFNNIPKISRADLADYIVNHLVDEKAFNLKVEVLY